MATDNSTSIKTLSANERRLIKRIQQETVEEQRALLQLFEFIFKNPDSADLLLESSKNGRLPASETLAFLKRATVRQSLKLIDGGA